MIKNYIKIAWRNLLKNKIYSIINIIGLAIGMLSSIIILLWVQNELSYDKSHEEADQIFRLTCDAGEGFKAAVTPAGMAIGLREERAEIINATRLSYLTPTVFSVEDKTFEEEGVFYADSNFLQMFSFPLITGDPNTALSDPDKVIITKAIAEKYFGTKNPIGQFIQKENRENLIVSGVWENAPTHSHLQFDVLIPMANLRRGDRDLQTNTWDNFNFYTYLKLDQKTSHSNDLLKVLEGDIQQAFAKRNKYIDVSFNLQPLTDIHLHSDLQIDLPGHGNAQYVRIFFLIAFVILIVACINFMNLSTARSAHRAKEVGLRKVVGANRVQLIAQFMSESIIISLFALILAIAMVFIFLPAFNDLTGRQLEFNLLSKKVGLGLLGIALCTGLVAGSYPALFLSGFRPIKVMRGKMKLGLGNLFLRNGLVTTQFIVSVLLLVSTFVVFKQLNYIKNKNLGFNQSNLIYIPMKGAIWGKIDALKSSLSSTPLTEDFAMVSELPVYLQTGDVDIKWKGKDPNGQVVIPHIHIDENFTDVFEVEMLVGRNYTNTFETDSANYLINEKAMKLMGFNRENVIGETLDFGDYTGTIIGVVKNFNFKPLQHSIEPLILKPNDFGGIVIVRTQPGKTENTIASLKEIYGTLNPSFPLSYHFIDQEIENLYKGEQQMSAIFKLFALLAIFISCIGLYGLSSFVTEQRFKEIGIRKVLGASTLGLVNLLSKDFLKLVLFALIIAIPISWYAMNIWLRDFAFHINVNWSVFAIAGVTVLLITICTVSFQGIRAARTNPIKSLRTE